MAGVHGAEIISDIQDSTVHSVEASDSFTDKQNNLESSEIDHLATNSIKDETEDEEEHSAFQFTNPFASSGEDTIERSPGLDNVSQNGEFNNLVNSKFSSLAKSSTDESYLPPPGMGTRRFSVSAESMDPSTVGNVEKIFIYKSPDQKERISKALKGNFLFEQLDEDSYTGVVDAMEEKTIGPNTDVIIQGDVGDYFYIVEKGKFDIFKSKVNSEGKMEGEPALVATVEDGGSFGEMALMYNSPRAATVRSVTDATLWSIDRITFRHLLMERTFKKRQMYEKFLTDIPLLSKLEPYELQKISDSLESCVYEDGEFVIKQGDFGDSFYLIEEGHAIVLKKSPRSVFKEDDPILKTTPVKMDPPKKKSSDKGEGAQADDTELEDYFERQVGKLGKGDYFGELALLSNETRKATIVADGKLKCVKMSKLSFERLLGPLIKTFRRKSTLYE
ncbi:cAMP-dependent protein kinase regulatory subunit [Smittium culicis]|uniref:cAMP-dependent protein kinase regulatory subunit n=1 Tax=Smittium culicis TaxID=133412 RepID=A0A1R1X182_9FUNG|nr:cAMP-dependent protein kinase regulatory subunit [Smittium culicis]